MKQIVVAILFVSISLLCRAQDRSGQITRILSATAASSAQIQSAHAPGIHLELRGIYVLDGLLWFKIRATNTSVFDWHGSPMRFSIRDRHVLRRRARQEIPLTTFSRREPLFVPSDSAVILVYALAPRLPTNGQRLVLEYANRTADRHLSLRLSGKQLLHAKKLGSHGNVQPGQRAQNAQSAQKAQGAQLDPRSQQMVGAPPGR